MDGSQASVTVTPKDRLVIGFGDSFTSGEGNPELTAHFSGAPWQNGNLPARALDPVSLADKDTRAQWTDRWCHRSVYSWQIRTALAAALSDPRQSFTILPYGCSGATIPEGILYGYNGVEWSQASDKGIVGSRSEVGLAYQEICQPQAFRSYCVSGAPWCGRTEPPTVGQEQAPGFYDAAGPGLRHAVMRCGPNNVFKRAADALLIDIGINDVGFAGWAAAIILQDPGLRFATHAAAPCFDGTANCTGTQKLFATLVRRYDLLRTVLVQYMLPDFGIDPSHVIVAVYPPALENENGAFCPQGNAGLTIATLPSRNPFASACSGSILAGGALAEYPASDQVERDVEQARVKLNESLVAFALKPPAFDVVTGYTSDYAKRGVCATTDPQSRPPGGDACFTVTDLANLRCDLSAEFDACAASRSGRLPRRHDFPAVSADPIRALPEPHPALPHHERRLSRHQPEASVLSRRKRIRRARSIRPRDGRRLPPDGGRTRDDRQRCGNRALSKRGLRSLTGATSRSGTSPGGPGSRAAPGPRRRAGCRCRRSGKTPPRR